MDELTAPPIRCFLLDHGYTTQTSGPCCKVQDFKIIENEVWEKVITNYTKLHKHTKYQEIKSSMDAGEWHTACQSCRDDEARNLESMRINHNHYFSSMPSANGLVNLTIWTGRECNLQCRTCSPYCSSSWDKEMREDFFLTDYSYIDDWPTEVFYIKKFTSYEPENFENVRSLILTGGEPLYNKESFPLLESIATQTQGQCTLIITTNCTVAMDLKTFPFLEKFKRVNFICSIDGTEKDFEFIRTGANWEKAKKNIKHYQSLGINLSYHFTHSALNLFTTVKTRQWLEEQGIQDCGLKTIISRPEYLTYGIFNDTEKEKFREWWQRQHYSPQYDYILSSLDSYTYNEAFRKRFFSFMEHTKKYHDLDWKIHLPELYNLMHE